MSKPSFVIGVAVGSGVLVGVGVCVIGPVAVGASYWLQTDLLTPPILLAGCARAPVLRRCTGSTRCPAPSRPSPAWPGWWTAQPGSAALGSFLALIAPPLGLGSVQLADGSWVKGFICEGAALAGASDISHFGGWRAYRASTG